MKWFQTILLLPALALFGCSDNSRPSQKIAQQLDSADRLEVTNRNYAVGITIKDAELRSLINAFKSGRKKKTGGTSLDWSNPIKWDLKFFAGTNLVAEFPAQYGIFKIEGVEYNDGSESLEDHCVAWDKMRIASGHK